MAELPEGSWVSLITGCEMPPGSVIGGIDKDKNNIYVGRTTYKGDSLAVKIIPAVQYASLAYGNKEIPVTEFEALVGYHFRWIASDSRITVPGAVCTGQSYDGENLFIGRGVVKRSKSVTPGKIEESNLHLFVPYKKKVFKLDDYEILVYDANSEIQDIQPISMVFEDGEDSE